MFKKVSLDQCESKWKNLIRTYNLVKAKLTKDPKAQTKFHYLFEFDELMSMLEKVRPRSKSEDCDEDNYQEGFHGFDGFENGNDDTIIIDYDDGRGDNDGDTDHSDEVAEDDNAKIWTSEETFALLDAIRQKKEEMGNDKSPRFWDSIANDLCKYNYYATPYQCDTKWKSLKRTHRKVKERILDTKVTTTKFSYFSLVDEIIRNEEVFEMDKDTKSLQKILESTMDDDDDDDDSREVFAKKIKLDEDKDIVQSS
ncbi:zinc finger and SCAN domain-containing protein 29-like isoform X2 [Agrilus planipennis]|uniref:Zinc finger and SCAN domain-containing protein 29-like isoform X2 n=1 Tax=Agrilus planipennis TaxID=224129 RepID=A0A1W4XJS2_AGRPL|nr:zinc finger and SCAN domain-containing protein 29-like isoform X2 [Agrilus planipennis]